MSSLSCDDLITAEHSYSVHGLVAPADSRVLRHVRGVGLICGYRVKRRRNIARKRYLGVEFEASIEIRRSFIHVGHCITAMYSFWGFELVPLPKRVHVPVTHGIYLEESESTMCGYSF